MKLVTARQMRALEQAAVDQGATWAGLMEQAGWGVAQVAMQRLGSVAGQPVLVLVGPGNNGGDGLVAARHLHDAGALVTLYIWRRTAAGDINRGRCRERQIAEVEASDDPAQTRLAQLLAEGRLVIDALLGSGLSRPVTGDLAAIVAVVNSRGVQLADEHETIDERMTEDGRRRSDAAVFRLPSSVRGGESATVVDRPPSSVHAVVLAIDLPSGIDADSGALLGVAIRADLTVATGLVKRGLLCYPGRAYVGTLCLAEIGLARDITEDVMSEQIDAAQAASLLPARPVDAHKGTFGKVMVVAGSLLYPGAAHLATAGAARVGAGLVTLATGRSTLAVGRLAEVTLRPLSEAEPGILGAAAADELLKHLVGYRALLIGPGLGHEKPTRAFLERLLQIDAPKQRGQIGFRFGGASEKAAEPEGKTAELPPLVLDADALNILAEIEGWWEHLPTERCVLTPHPGEMQRLLKTEALPADLVEVAETAAATWGQVVVLKGATTVVARPGASAVYDGANPALATAGTGDVLAGAIAGLLAQGVTPFDAAVLGVYLHGAAGQVVRAALGDAGAIASDLLPQLPLAIKGLRA